MDLAAKYSNAPHSVVLGIKFGIQEVPVSLGTFPTVDEALNASSAAIHKAEAMIAASPLADSVIVNSTIFPAPVDWQERVADVLVSMKEEQDEYDEWVKQINESSKL